MLQANQDFTTSNETFPIWCLEERGKGKWLVRTIGVCPQHELPPAYVVPYPQLETDSLVYPKPLEADCLVQPHARVIG